MNSYSTSNATRQTCTHLSGKLWQKAEADHVPKDMEVTSFEIGKILIRTFSSGKECDDCSYRTCTILKPPCCKHFFFFCLNPPPPPQVRKDVNNFRTLHRIWGCFMVFSTKWSCTRSREINPFDPFTHLLWLTERIKQTSTVKNVPQ